MFLGLWPPRSILEVSEVESFLCLLSLTTAMKGPYDDIGPSECSRVISVISLNHMRSVLFSGSANAFTGSRDAYENIFGGPRFSRRH